MLREKGLADRYNEKNTAISATHTHSGPGGYFQFFLFTVTTSGFQEDTLEIIVDGVVRVSYCSSKETLYKFLQPVRGVWNGFNPLSETWTLTFRYPFNMFRWKFIKVYLCWWLIKSLNSSLNTKMSSILPSMEMFCVKIKYFQFYIIVIKKINTCVKQQTVINLVTPNYNTLTNYDYIFLSTLLINILRKAKTYPSFDFDKIWSKNKSTGF